jgi:hypothetical protein
MLNTQRIQKDVSLQFFVLDVLFIAAYRNVWPGGVSAFEIRAIVRKNDASVQTQCYIYLNNILRVLYALLHYYMKCEGKNTVVLVLD